MESTGQPEGHAKGREHYFTVYPLFYGHKDGAIYSAIRTRDLLKKLQREQVDKSDYKNKLTELLKSM